MTFVADATGTPGGAGLMNGDRTNGIIIIDKPTGMSSARVVAKVKGLLQTRKVGHTGTLDPFASGVLVCCLNQATKLARFLLQGTKSYEAVLKLGASTDTQDVTGKIIGQPASVEISEQQLLSAFERFKGAIDQHPPVYSALKHKGTPLYKLARSGQPVQKPPRRVHIYALDIGSIQLPLVSFTVVCSAGTYIRTLCHDIGDLLGCGGFLQSLRRTDSSGFSLDQALTLDRIGGRVQSGTVSKQIVPMAAALPQMPEWEVDAATAEKIRQGQPLTENDYLSVNGARQTNALEGPVKVVDVDRKLVSVLKRSSDSHRLEYCCVFPN